MPGMGPCQSAATPRATVMTSHDGIMTGLPSFAGIMWGIFYLRGGIWGNQGAFEGECCQP